MGTTTETIVQSLHLGICTIKLCTKPYDKLMIPVAVVRQHAGDLYADG